MTYKLLPASIFFMCDWPFNFKIHDSLRICWYLFDTVLEEIYTYGLISMKN